MTDMPSPTSTTDVDATARRMLARYSRAQVAAEMAHEHASDYPATDPRHAHWVAVRDRICQIAIAERFTGPW